MKYLFLLFFSAFFCFAKYTFCQPTPPPSCQIPVGLMLDTLINLSIEQYAPGLSQEEKDKRIGSYTLGKLERFRAAMEEEPLDSLFRFSRQYLSERMGEEIFCRRVRLWPSSFNYWRGQVDFVFHFYFKEDFEKKRTRSQIKLRFKKQKIGTYEFSPPDNVPACAERPEECEFNFLSLVEALERVQKAGLLDIASPYRIEREPSAYKIVIRTPGGDGYERHINIAMRDGSISEDTVSLERFYGRQTMAEQLKRANWVVEAERIKKTKGYRAKSGIHTSHIFKIYKIFKGEIGRDTFEVPQLGGELDGKVTMVSHSLNIPSKGIFFLKEMPNPEQYNSEDSIYNYPKKYNSGTPLSYDQIGNDVPPFWATNIEGFLYPKLESYTGQPYREVSGDGLSDTTIVNWLREVAPGNDSLHKEKGISLGIWRAELDAERNRLEVFIAGRTSAGFSYPTKMRFVIAYNPSAFGDSLAAKELVEVNRNISRTSIGRERIPKAFFPADYVFRTRDLEPGVLEITFEKPPDAVPSIQLLPRPKNSKAHFRELLFSFSLPIAADSSRIGLHLLNEPFADDFFHYDHLKKEEKPYAFNHITGLLNYPISDKIMPVISGFKPDTASVGSDTVIDVWGENFLGSRSVVALRCEQEVSGTTYTRYCRIPEEYYTYRSASHLKFRVPEKMRGPNWDRLDAMKPVSGTLYVINRVGDEDKLSTSQEILVISPDDGLK